MLGAWGAPDVVNEPLSLAVDEPTATLMMPPLEPGGIVTTSCVCVAETTVAATPPIVTTSLLGLVENPVP